VCLLTGRSALLRADFVQSMDKVRHPGFFVKSLDKDSAAEVAGGAAAGGFGVPARGAAGPDGGPAPERVGGVPACRRRGGGAAGPCHGPGPAQILARRRLSPTR